MANSGGLILCLIVYGDTTNSSAIYVVSTYISYHKDRRAMGPPLMLDPYDRSRSVETFAPKSNEHLARLTRKIRRDH